MENTALDTSPDAANGTDPTTIGLGQQPVTSDRQSVVTVPGLSLDEAADTADELQRCLVSVVDLAMTVKHIHWNVVGPHFIGVHEMLDPQYDGLQDMIDDLAERIAALGATPTALAGRIVEQREREEYDLDRADSIAHLGALDVVYRDVIAGHRRGIAAMGDLDPVSEDLLIGQTAVLEKYHWFVRSHLANWAGGMANAGAPSAMEAARAVAAKSHNPVGSRTARTAES